MFPPGVAILAGAARKTRKLCPGPIGSQASPMYGRVISLPFQRTMGAARAVIGTPQTSTIIDLAAWRPKRKRTRQP